MQYALALVLPRLHCAWHMCNWKGHFSTSSPTLPLPMSIEEGGRYGGCGVSNRSNYVFQMRMCAFFACPLLLPSLLLLTLADRLHSCPPKKTQRTKDQVKVLLAVCTKVHLFIWSSHSTNEPTNSKANMPWVRASVQVSTCMWCEVYGQSSVFCCGSFSLSLVSVFVELASMHYVIS